MSKVNSVKKGTILSETSFFKVEEVKPDGMIVVKDDYGNEVKIGQAYVDKVLVSADFFDKEEQRTMTDLADILIKNPRTAMTVAFYKKDVNKTKKAYESELNAVIDRIQKANISEIQTLLKEAFENPVSKVIKGDLRVIKGRHYGHIDDLGRVHFIDMELDKDPKREDDSRSRQVDTRSIAYIILNGTKYNLKK